MESVTGEADGIGDLGGAGLAQAADGTVYAGASNRLYVVDLDTGLATEVPGPALNDAWLSVSRTIRGLAFAPDGILWALAYYPGPGGASLPNNELWRFDLAAVIATKAPDPKAGISKTTALYSLAIDDGGTLYTVLNLTGTNWPQIPAGLCTVDTSSGALIPVHTGPEAPVFEWSWWLDFDPCGRLLGGRDNVNEIDPTTGSFTVLSTAPSWVTAGIALPQPDWQSLDVGGLAGSLGVPTLTGDGVTAPGSTVSLTVAGAAPFAPVFLVGGGFPIELPFLGGVLVPSLDAILGGYVTDTSGVLVASGTWPAATVGCVRLWWQAFVLDASGPAGWTATHAVLSQSH